MSVRLDLAVNRLAPVLSIDALRAVERKHAHQPLMERAGTAAAGIAAAMLAPSPGRVVVLAGPGNNGGDAFVCARVLRERGFAVDVVTAGDPSRLPRDAATAWTALQPSGARFVAAPPDGAPALIVDGLFGVGLSRSLASPYAGWVEWANASTAPILALDVPSGLDAGTGVAHGCTTHR